MSPLVAGLVVQLLVQLEPEGQAAVVELIKKLHPAPKDAAYYLEQAQKLIASTPPVSSS